MTEKLKLIQIISILENDNMSFHHKCFLLNGRELPKLPPDICPCIVTLVNEEKVCAYIDSAISKNKWIEYGDSPTIRRKGRRRFDFEQVKDWKLIER